MQDSHLIFGAFEFILEELLLFLGVFLIINVKINDSECAMCLYITEICQKLHLTCLTLFTQTV